MAAFSDIELHRLLRAAEILCRAEERLPVLGSTVWSPDLARRFFDGGAKDIPKPVYPRLDPAPAREATAEVRKLVDGYSPVHNWLLRLADVIDDTAALLSSLGTDQVLAISSRLYGSPLDPIADGKVTTLGLAKRLDALLSEFREPQMLAGDTPTLNAEQVKARLDRDLPGFFADETPRVEIVPHLSAKAVAGKDYIKLRETASFSDLDATQLLHHEALVHIATGKNGRAQKNFPILGEAHPGNTTTQEGLAVFAEFMSGSLDPKRLKRLADRVIAIQMSIDGADFIELYRYFLDAADTEFEAFESARRVVRGGLAGGGGPLTKDVVYLLGLLEVHSFLRSAVQAGDPSHARLLFVGKFSLHDLEAMVMLRTEGLIDEPRFMPDWARDLRYLTSYLAYSVFLNQIDLSSVHSRYQSVFEQSTAMPPKETE